MHSMDMTNAKLHELIGKTDLVLVDTGVIKLPVFQNSVVMTPYYNYLTRQGKTYYVENVFTMPSATTTNIVFDTTACTKEIVAFPSFWHTSVGPVLITLGVCTSYLDGTALTVTNRHYLHNGNEVVVTLVLH